MTIEDFADFTRCPVSEIQEYCEAGLLDPDGDGVFDDADVLRLQIVRSTIRQQRTIPEIQQEVRTSDHPIVGRLFRASGRRYTIDEAAELTGIDVERLRVFNTILFASGDERLDDEDLENLRLDPIMQMPWEVQLEGARIYGDGLRRLADAGAHLTHRYLCEPLQRAGMNDVEVVEQMGSALGDVTSAVTRMVHHMWSDYLLQAAIDHAVLHLLPRDPDAPPGTVDTTIVFADLALSTSIAELEGDEAAYFVIDRTDRAVRELAWEHGGKLVKQIGDEFMLTFGEPAAAVRFAVKLQDHIQRTEERHIAARIGIHSGRVLFRLGDYYGQAVNVAARIVSMALPHAILLTEPVAKAAANEGIQVEEIGVRSLRGMEEPLPLYRVMSAEREG
jgi:class 3 adenylate cyclase/DNA-binding transcriptional MerR regulator